MMKTISVVRPAQTFRMSWLRLYAAVTFWAIVALSLPILFLLPLMLFTGQWFTGRAVFTTAAGLLTGLTFGVIFAALIAACYPVHLSNDGLNGFNFWGFRIAIAWNDMVSATPLRFMNLPWLIVRSHRTKNALWLPLFYADNRKFQAAVMQFAPADCPLVDFATVEAPLPPNSGGF